MLYSSLDSCSCIDVVGVCDSRRGIVGGAMRSCRIGRWSRVKHCKPKMKTVSSVDNERATVSLTIRFGPRWMAVDVFRDAAVVGLN